VIDMRTVVGSHDIALVTLDTLRFDVAERALQRGQTPNLARLLPGGAWERRHTPGSFTYAAHAAFFAGFLPTPVRPGRHERLFACAFPGSETVGPGTCVLEAPDVPSGLAGLGYRTVCVGGVGFFNPRSPLGRVLPGLFQEAHWGPELGVTDPRSTEHQVALAARRLGELAPGERAFLFLNVSALHQPNHHYLPGAREDSPETQAAALAYVDAHLPRLVAALERRGPALLILTSDHGEAYGEDGFHGHRLAHETVWTVPYAEVILPARPAVPA
jgi:arylsulfatase A-like enzyme